MVLAELISVLDPDGKGAHVRIAQRQEWQLTT
jgi:hypothetical protein